MKTFVKNSALQRIQTMDMFSKEGWKAVHHKCGHIKPYQSDMELADGFIDFQIAWYDDHNLFIEDFEESEREELEKELLDRYTDYLLKD